MRDNAPRRRTSTCTDGDSLASGPNHKLERHLLPAVRDLVFNKFAANMDAISFICNLRTRHALMTRDPSVVLKETAGFPEVEKRGFNFTVHLA